MIYMYIFIFLPRISLFEYIFLWKWYEITFFVVKTTSWINVTNFTVACRKSPCLPSLVPHISSKISFRRPRIYAVIAWNFCCWRKFYRFFQQKFHTKDNPTQRKYILYVLNPDFIQYKGAKIGKKEEGKLSPYRYIYWMGIRRTMLGMVLNFVCIKRTFQTEGIYLMTGVDSLV